MKSVSFTVTWLCNHPPSPSGGAGKVCAFKPLCPVTHCWHSLHGEWWWWWCGVSACPQHTTPPAPPVLSLLNLLVLLNDCLNMLSAGKLLQQHSTKTADIYIIYFKSHLKCSFLKKGILQIKDCLLQQRWGEWVCLKHLKLSCETVMKWFALCLT